MSNEKTLDISWTTILKIAFVVLILYILYQVQHILIWFIFAVIISLLFEPLIEFLIKLKIPRLLAVCFVYILFLGTLIFFVYSTIPFFVSEIKQFSQVLPQYFEKISPPLQNLGIKAFEDFDTFIKTIGDVLDKIVANIFNVLFVIFGGIFATIFILTSAIFLSLEEKGTGKIFAFIFPKKYENYFLAIWKRCQIRVAGWFFTRIIACLFVGIVSLISFLLFNTPYPFTLGLISGSLNFIPIVGPIVTGILLFIIIAVQDVSKAIFVLITFILIQQVENNILTPLLSKKLVDLSPVLVLISMTIGGTVFGFLGAILAVPLAGIFFEFFKEFLERRKEEKIEY